MNPLLQDIRRTRLLWLLLFVPVVFLTTKLKPEAQTLLFVLSVLAIVPLTVLLSHATESVAAKIGDALGGLLNATLGNLAELIIALTALRAGQYPWAAFTSVPAAIFLSAASRFPAWIRPARVSSAAAAVLAAARDKMTAKMARFMTMSLAMSRDRIHP